MNGVNVMESILNVRSQNEATLLPLHAVVIMVLDFGKRCAYCYRYCYGSSIERLQVNATTGRRTSWLLGDSAQALRITEFLDFAHRPEGGRHLICCAT